MPAAYLKTPAGIMEILALFRRHSLNYLLFKCEHIFQGQNKNLDILFETEKDYERAAILLEEKGFSVRLSEKVEKYKTMYAGFLDDIPYSIHLHREIAWHGMVALDKKEVFMRAQKVHSLVKIPCLEDSLLIHAAHVLFENFLVTEREENYLRQAYAPGVDKGYILRQLRQNHWRYGFRKVLRYNSGDKLPKIVIGKVWLRKLLWEPAAAFYLSRKLAKKIGRKMISRRRGCLISLSGINGSGKSTLARNLFTAYQPLTTHLGKNSHYYYYGWEPEFFLTRFLSAWFQRRDKKLFKEVNLQPEQPPGFSLYQELLFSYIFLEFYYRYRKNILPKLKKGDLIITDRYFYDIFGQYPYARNSRVLKTLLKLFPAPDAAYVLDADLPTIMQRKKTDRKNNLKIAATKRAVLPREYLLQQQQNYHRLSSLLPARRIKTGRDPERCAGLILQQTWRKVI